MEMNKLNPQQDDFSMDQFAHEMEQQLLSRRRALEGSSAGQKREMSAESLTAINEEFLTDDLLNQLEAWSPAPAPKPAQNSNITSAEQIEFKLQDFELTADSASTLEFDTSLDTLIDDLPEIMPEFVAEVKEAIFPVSLPAALCDEHLLSEISSIPQKMGFKIGEVADMLGIKQYVLRYWESEFDVLKPKKAPNNQRLYTRKDVENAYIIRKLLHRDRFSIEGARHAMKELKGQVRKEKNWNTVVNKIEKIEDKVTDFAAEVKRIKMMFR